jgi:hypothetical protein
MIGDQREYRRHAARCAQLAVFARTSQLKAAFLGLSKNWETFAVALEDSLGRLEEAKDVTARARQSLAETRRLHDLLLSQK